MVGHNGDCFGKVQTGTSAEGSMHSDHKGDENNPNKSVGDARESANSRVESVALVDAYALQSQIREN